MKKTKLSIITTCYNASNYIQFALDSISKQITNDCISIEYIIVNDCSTDNSLDIVEEFKTKNKDKENFQVKIYTPKKNLGCGGARKYGIHKATGDYFMFLDADDYYINDDFCFRAVTDIQTEGADIVEYGVIYNDKFGGKAYDMISKEKKIINSGIDGVYWIFKDNTIKFNVWSKIYTKEIIKSVEYDDTREYEDIRTVPYYVYNANKIVVLPNIEINYRAAINSIVRNNDINTRLGTIKAMTEVCRSFKEYPNIVKALYDRAMIDICAIMDGKTSIDDGFDEMSKYNTELLSYIYPDTYKDITYNVPENTHKNKLNNNKK